MTSIIGSGSAQGNSPVYELGLVGYPLAHSLSPKIHQAALESLQLCGTYQLYPVPPDESGKSVLEQLVRKVRDGVIQGLNVTIPHKQNVLDYLDHLSPVAAAIGAVNTIYLDKATLVGENTDVPGFWLDISKYLGPDDMERKGLILGAGGSARAVAFALLKAGFEVTIASRRIAQALEIKDHFKLFQDRISVISWDSISEINAGMSIIVNATPLGMHPHTSTSPWPDGVPFPKDSLVYDLVYNPVETRLVKEARSQGVKAVGGLGMLVEQAALSFQQWTGLSAPREVMMEAAYEE